MTTGITGLGRSHLWHLWCSNTSCVHLSMSSSDTSVIHCVYVITPVFGPAQLRVSFAVVKGLTHDTRFLLRFRS